MAGEPGAVKVVAQCGACRHMNWDNRCRSNPRVEMTWYGPQEWRALAFVKNAQNSCVEFQPKRRRWAWLSLER